MGIEEKPAPLPAPEPVHFGYIDTVRGLAFFAVLVLHTGLSVGPFPGKDLLQGGYGVQLFFLASAITLCHSMAERRRSEPFPVFYFYLRRWFRIAPLFWFGMVLYWTIPAIIPRFWLLQWAPQGVHPSYFVLTALFLQGWHPCTFDSIVPGGWSIAVEMTFYIFFPLLFCWLKNAKRAMAAVVLAVLYLKLLDHVGATNSHSLISELRAHLYPGTTDAAWNFFISLWFPAQLPVFIVGFLAYHLIKSEFVNQAARDPFWANCLFFFCLVFLAGLFRGQARGFIPNFMMIVFALAAMILAMSGGALRWLINPWTRYLGKISFSGYLMHFAALGITLRLFGIHLTGASQAMDAGSSAANLLLFLKLLAVSLGLTVIISTITYHLIEKPGIALGRKLIQWLTVLSAARHPVAVGAEVTR